MTIKRMGFVKRQKYKIYMFIEHWMDRKIALNRRLTLFEGMGLLIAYPIYWLIDPYKMVGKTCQKRFIRQLSKRIR